MPEESNALRRYALPREGRLSRNEYPRVFREGKVFASQFVVLYCLKSGPGKKVGVVVSKKKAGGAVPRNRLKRILRESYRSLRPSLTSDCMVILVGRKEALAVSKVVLEQALCVLFGRAGMCAHA